MNSWNDKNPKALVVALESPHNSVHLAAAVRRTGARRFLAYSRRERRHGRERHGGARPDLYFHHCFIDYVFWIWQRRHGATESLDIDANDPGAKYDSQINPPPAGADPNATMSLTTPLEPFFKEYGVPFTTADVINIESQLGYAYGPGSLDGYVRTDTAQPMTLVAEPEQKTVHVAGIDRSKIRGSFLIATWADLEGEKQLIGLEPVSAAGRWPAAPTARPSLGSRPTCCCRRRPIPVLSG